MNNPLSSLSLEKKLPVPSDNIPPVDKQKNKNSITRVTSERKNPLDAHKIGTPGKATSEPLASITVAGSSHQRFNREEISAAYHQIEAEIASFFPICEDEKMLSQIFIFDTKGEKIELHENTLEEEIGDLALESSHEKAKEHLVALFTELYGKEAVAIICSPEELEQPLTVTKAATWRATFGALVDAAIADCKGDLSKYDACLAEQLKRVEEVKNAIAQPRPPTSEELSYIDFFCNQTGFPPFMVYAGLLAGGVVAATAATGGIALPVAFHAAMTAASTHTSVLGAALHLGGGTSPLAAAVGGTTSNAAAIAQINATGVSGLVGTAMGGSIGAALGASTGRRGNILIGAGAGMVSGMVGGLLIASYGTALLNGLVNVVSASFNSLIVGAQSAPVTPVSIGAVAGGGAGAMWRMASAGRDQRPASNSALIGSAITGAAAGGLVGGLSSFINPLVAGGASALVQLGREVVNRDTDLHDQEEHLRRVGRTFGVGVGVGLFGGLCSAIAHGIVAANLPAMPAYLGVAAGSAVITALTEGLSQPNEVEEVPINEQEETPFAHAEFYEERSEVHQAWGSLPVATAIPARRN